MCNRISEIIAQVIVCNRWGTNSVNGTPAQWRKRAYNKEADFLANQAMNRRGDINWINPLLGQLTTTSFSICG
eukprot:671121-Karenia_brevis.AAC.1